MMTARKYDVLTICNPLMDILVDASDDEIIKFHLQKGHMHLMDQHKRNEMLAFFGRREMTVELGGSAMNAVRAMALLKKRAMFVGMISHDEFGEKIKRRMEDLSIHSELHIADKESTGICLVLVTPDGERTMNTYLGASCLFTKEVVPLDDFKDCAVFHVSGYQWLGTTAQREAIRLAINRAKANGCLVSFDLADPSAVAVWREEFADVIENDADIVFANREEASMLYHLDTQATAKRIASFGALAAIKLGSEGALLQQGDHMVTVPAEPTKVVDTTGAGDMFAGGLLFGMTSGKNLEVSGKIAALLASDVISRYGAHLSDRVITRILQDFS